MALSTTTLAVAAAKGDETISVTSATGATVDGFVRINNEFALIQAINGTVLTLKRRGLWGTQAKAHAILSPITYGLASDLSAAGERLHNVPAQQARDVVSIGADGAIALPTRDTVVFLTKATALAATLADPTADMDGVIVHLVSTTAAAHVITLTTGYLGSAASDVLTFAAAKGHSKTLMAVKGVWVDIATSTDASEAAGVSVA